LFFKSPYKGLFYFPKLLPINSFDIFLDFLAFFDTNLAPTWHSFKIDFEEKFCFLYMSIS
jgi:hypothetical protein